MNISQIQTLDDGMSGISCSGMVTYAKQAVNKIGEHNGQPYNFWIQFVVIKDTTGDIGVNLNLGDDSSMAMNKGQRIAVEKGTVNSYTDDKGKLRKSLRASLNIGDNLPQGQQAPQQTRQAANDPQQEQLTTRTSIERQTAWRGACDRCVGSDVSREEVVKIAQVGAYFIATGFNLTDAEKNKQTMTELEEQLGEEPREPGEDQF